MGSTLAWSRVKAVLSSKSCGVPADPAIVLGAVLAEVFTGRPGLWRGAISHPVSWIARLIRALEGRLNRPELNDANRRAGGIVTVILLVGAAALVGHGLDRWFAHVPWGLLPAALIGSLGLAHTSLYLHVAAVHRPLAANDLPAARLAVGGIVGRDTVDLDAEGVATAALESLAESFNDGVVAPLFWFLIGGLAGLFAYKAVNTADSLIGHKEAPYYDFGWAAARTDDVMNLIPARLAGGVIALVSGGGWRTMLRDAPRHTSPNAGWPEAALAGALGVRLGGPASYDGVTHQRPVFGHGPRPKPADLKRGLRLYLRACGALAAALVIGALAWPR
jgi:adenosylcobinamide-phosphate synthase